MEPRSLLIQWFPSGSEDTGAEYSNKYSDVSAWSE